MSYFTIQSAALSKGVVAPGESVTATVRLTSTESNIKLRNVQFCLTALALDDDGNEVGTQCAGIVTLNKTFAAKESATVSVAFTLYGADDAASTSRENTFAALNSYTRRASGNIYVNVVGVTTVSSATHGELSKPTSNHNSYFVRAQTTSVAIDRRCAPSIALFSGERVRLDNSGTCITAVPDDEGDCCMLSLRAAVADDRWVSDSGWTCSLAFDDGSSISLPNEVALAGLSDDFLLLQGRAFSTGSDHTLTLSFGDAYERAAAVILIPRSFANVHLAGASTGGVALGKFSAATEGKPLFECEYPAVFGGNVAMAANALLRQATVSYSVSVSKNDRAKWVTIPVADFAASFPDDGDTDHWTPLCCCGFYVNNQLWYFSQARWVSSQQQIAACVVRADGSATAAETLTLTIYILFIRTSL